MIVSVPSTFTSTTPVPVSTHSTEVSFSNILSAVPVPDPVAPTSPFCPWSPLEPVPPVPPVGPNSPFCPLLPVDPVLP